MRQKVRVSIRELVDSSFEEVYDKYDIAGVIIRWLFKHHYPPEVLDQLERCENGNRGTR